MPIPKRVPVTEVDNRDSSTTWLWISPTEYVEIDPRELYTNMVENCEAYFKEVDSSDLQAMADFLNEKLNRS